MNGFAISGNNDVYQDTPVTEDECLKKCIKMAECKTNEEVKTLCAELAMAQTWRIGQLYLPFHMRAGGWEALGNVIGQGKVGNVLVSEVGLASASDQQIEALWQITETDGVWRNHEEEMLCEKSDGHDGLQMLLAIRKSLKFDVDLQMRNEADGWWQDDTEEM